MYFELTLGRGVSWLCIIVKALEKVKETVAFSEMIRDTIGHRSLTICEDRDYPPGSYFALERLISVPPM